MLASKHARPCARRGQVAALAPDELARHREPHATAVTRRPAALEQALGTVGAERPGRRHARAGAHRRPRRRRRRWSRRRRGEARCRAGRRRPAAPIRAPAGRECRASGDTVSPRPAAANRGAHSAATCSATTRARSATRTGRRGSAGERLEVLDRLHEPVGLGEGGVGLAARRRRWSRARASSSRRMRRPVSGVRS